MHSQKLLEHFANPRHTDPLENPTHTIREENPVCGDQLLVHLAISTKIDGISFRARGCTATIACGSALCELLLGRTVEDLPAITRDEIERAVEGLMPESKHAAQLAAGIVRKLEKQWKP